MARVFEESQEVQSFAPVSSAYIEDVLAILVRAALRTVLIHMREEAGSIFTSGGVVEDRAGEARCGRGIHVVQELPTRALALIALFYPRAHIS